MRRNISLCLSQLFFSGSAKHFVRKNMSLFASDLQQKQNMANSSKKRVSASFRSNRWASHCR